MIVVSLYPMSTTRQVEIARVEIATRWDARKSTEETSKWKKRTFAMHSRMTVGVSTDSTIEIFRSFGLTRRYLDRGKTAEKFRMSHKILLEKYFCEKSCSLIIQSHISLFQHILYRFDLCRKDETWTCFTGKSKSEFIKNN